jgi:ABC-type glycerol-3-phosphate transport system substrate-binding protein
MSRGLLALLASAVALTGCSDSSSEGTDSSPQAPTPTVAVVNPEPAVDLIDEAIAALEAETGAPQDFFEINATPRLVNLFVALNDGAVVQPWVYFDGELSSSEAQPAQGNTFKADAVDFDPALVLAGITSELPNSVYDAFTIEGGAEGVVRYSVIVTSAAGGQLVVVVAADGTVLSVDPV